MENHHLKSNLTAWIHKEYCFENIIIITMRII